MLDMARKEDAAGKLQGNSLPEVRAGLKLAATRIAEVVKREGRPLEEGPIISRLVAWFLLLPERDQEAIVATGHGIIEHLKEREPAPVMLDKQQAAAVRAELFGDAPLYPAPPQPPGKKAADPRDVLDVPPAKLVGGDSLGERRAVPRKARQARAVPHAAGRKRGDESE